MASGEVWANHADARSYISTKENQRATDLLGEEYCRSFCLKETGKGGKGKDSVEWQKKPSAINHCGHYCSPGSGEERNEQSMHM